MSEPTEIMASPKKAEMLEMVLVEGDLSKLTAPQRLDYYRQVCESMGLNPLSKPFDYIRLGGRLTLYAKKDATDQLRKIHGVSIDDIDIQETDNSFRVKVKGHDKTGRSDVEIGCVSRTDMSGNLQNAEMKAVTKAKRRLTLSLCGLGWLDETEIETIPQAKINVVNIETGELIEDKKPAPEKKAFDETEYLMNYTHPANIKSMPYDLAVDFKSDRTGKTYGEMTTKELYSHWMGLSKKLNDPNLDQTTRESISDKISAIATIMWQRHTELVKTKE